MTTLPRAYANLEVLGSSLIRPLSMGGIKLLKPKNSLNK
jgi:hypothetical protein